VTRPSRPRRFGAAGRYVPGLLMLVAAAVLGALVPIVFGAPQALVYITWKNPDERPALEQRFRLEEPSQIDGSTWSYVPRVTAPDLLRQIITHPAVGDTAGIDRPALRIASNAPLTPRRGGLVTAPAVARAVKGTAYVAALAGIVWLLITGWRAVHEAGLTISVVSLRRGLSHGVPVASAHAAAAFRVVFMACVLWLVAGEPAQGRLDPVVVEDAAGLRGTTVRWLAGHPAVATAIDPALYLAGALVLVGAGGPAVLAIFVVAFYLWASVVTLTTSHHTIVALQTVLIGLLGARWNDAWSVDAWWRQRTPGLPDRRYGFAIWLPGFVFGIGFLAAAWSKLDGGPAWVLNGTVKYHFVSDLNQAWVTWGPRLASIPGVAVAMSAAAVVVEIVVITGSFADSARWRAACGLMAASLLAGFALFQGVVWPGWWMLLLSFLPWQLIHSTARDRRSAAIGRLQYALAIAIVAAQVAVSAVKRELPPLFSAYDMYSTTYSTPDEYEWASNLEYRLAARADGRWIGIEGCVVDDVIAGRVREALAAAAPVPAPMRAMLARCLAVQPGVSAWRLEGDRRVYDWDAGVFSWRRGIDVIGPIEMVR
jgi:hypothetical protein